MSCNTEDKCDIDFNPTNLVCEKNTCYTLKENNTIARYNSNAVFKNVKICNSNGIDNQKFHFRPGKKGRSLENITLFN